MSELIYLKDRLCRNEIPVRGEGESEGDFQARMEIFRKEDRRVPIAGRGKENFGWCVSCLLGEGNTTGTLGNRDALPMPVMQDGEETGRLVGHFYGGGTFLSIP